MSDDYYRVSPMLAGVALGGLVALGLRVFYFQSNYIPKTDEVQQDYVVPNKLEIKLDDLDGNKQQEVIMEYDGRPYLLKLDDKGQPTVIPYKVVPRE